MRARGTTAKVKQDRHRNCCPSAHTRRMSNLIMFHAVLAKRRRSRELRLLTPTECNLRHKSKQRKSWKMGENTRRQTKVKQSYIPDWILSFWISCSSADAFSIIRVNATKQESGNIYRVL